MVRAGTERTWVTVGPEAIRANVRAITRRARGGEVMAVVKADAYGHGVGVVAPVCREEGVRHFAVATVAEAEELRACSGFAAEEGEIYLLSAFLPSEAPTVARLDLVPMVSSLEQYEALAEAACSAPKPRRCFLMLDTGMGREGAWDSEGDRLWKIALETPALRVTGIATHFSSADEPEADSVTEAQATQLREKVGAWGGDKLRGREDGRGGQGLWLSLCNSPAILRPEVLGELPDLGRGYLYRAGMILYGIEPYPDAFNPDEGMCPALCWFARVALVKDLPAGATIGYGRTHTLTHPARIATLSVGYADGLTRRLGNRGSVLLHCQRFPIVGRISMDQCQVDVTDCRYPVRSGDVATLIGRDGGESQSVLELATLLETTPHEIPCSLNKRVGRLVAE